MWPKWIRYRYIILIDCIYSFRVPNTILVFKNMFFSWCSILGFKCVTHHLGHLSAGKEFLRAKFSTAAEQLIIFHFSQLFIIIVISIDIIGNHMVVGRCL